MTTLSPSTATTPATATSHPLLARLPLEAGPVRVRALHAGDADALRAYRADPEVARYQGWTPLGPAEAAAFVAGMAEPPPWEIGTWVQLGIARSVDDAIVGDIGLLREAPDRVQLGFTLARAAQGRGWAQAALQALLPGGLRLLGITRLRAIADARNAPSLRLLQRLGFVETGREAVVFAGEACTDVTWERPLA